MSGLIPEVEAFEKGLSALYGYTSDEGGIRQAMIDESKVTFSDAKVMLVLCSAFVNFVLGKLTESNVEAGTHGTAEVQ